MSKGLLATCVALLLGGCVVAAPPPPRRAVIVTPPPPAPAAPGEVVPPAPGPGLVWVPGHYAWNGAAYVWRPGFWATPARPRSRVGAWSLAGRFRRLRLGRGPLAAIALT